MRHPRSRHDPDRSRGRHTHASRRNGHHVEQIIARTDEVDLYRGLQVLPEPIAPGPVTAGSLRHRIAHEHDRDRVGSPRRRNRQRTERRKYDCGATQSSTKGHRAHPPASIMRPPGGSWPLLPRLQPTWTGTRSERGQHRSECQLRCRFCMLIGWRRRRVGDRSRGWRTHAWLLSPRGRTPTSRAGSGLAAEDAGAVGSLAAFTPRRIHGMKDAGAVGPLAGLLPNPWHAPPQKGPASKLVGALLMAEDAGFEPARA